ncbi:MAG: GTP-binding protein [Okeania sp. SIO2H7]|nr:GTP-binding protein [Okeania sp. SIO2H7]
MDRIEEIPKRGMPVTIVTGFLGSGKTTLVNHILQNNRDLKVAVLVNEFGDINIDSQLLVSMEEDMVELSNGCICCTINEGLVDAVYKVLEREERVDYLIVETTGLAEPMPIILTFVGHEFGLRDLTRLDSIIAVVDSETFTPDHFESEAALKQIAFSDVVLLNKTDLAPLEKVEDLEGYIQRIKVGTRILRCQNSEVPLPLILDVGLTPVKTYQTQQGESHDHDHDHHDHNHHDHHHDHHHHHSDHLENDGFTSVSFRSDRPFDIDKFEFFLGEQMPTEVFRAKGILWFNKGGEERCIFQLSGPRYSIDADEWPDKPSNQLVFIGRNLDTDKIRQQLNDCLVAPVAV